MKNWAGVFWIVALRSLLPVPVPIALLPPLDIAKWAHRPRLFLRAQEIRNQRRNAGKPAQVQNMCALMNRKAASIITNRTDAVRNSPLLQKRRGTRVRTGASEHKWWDPPPGWISNRRAPNIGKPAAQKCGRGGQTIKQKIRQAGWQADGHALGVAVWAGPLPGARLLPTARRAGPPGLPSAPLGALSGCGRRAVGAGRALLNYAPGGLTDFRVGAATPSSCGREIIDFGSGARAACGVLASLSLFFLLRVFFPRSASPCLPFPTKRVSWLMGETSGQTLWQIRLSN